MLETSTFGVLHDLSIFVSLATALGVVAYRVMRHFRPEVSWNHEGQVLSRPYAAPDLMVLAMLGVLFLSTMESPSAEHANAAMSAPGIILSMAFNLIVCAALLLYLHRLRGLNPAELFGLQHLRWRWMGKVVLIFAVICVVAVSLVSIAVTKWLQDIWPDLQPQQMVEVFQTSGDLWIKVLVIVAAVVIAPLAEETLFRGFVYGVLKRYTDAPFAALSSSLMFAIIHMHVGSLLPLCMLAVLFCLAYEITGCLLAPMLLHMIFNGTSIVLMLVFDVK
jgi:membrane protease YdiL (CAAX protease family)